MRKLVSVLIYAVLVPLFLATAFAAVFFLVPQGFRPAVGWGVTALFAGLTISELREQLTGRLSEIMLKHLGSPARFRDACRIIVPRQQKVRKLALYGSFLNAVGACLALIVANTSADSEVSPFFLGLCASILTLAIFIHIWLSAALFQVENLFIEYLQEECEEVSREEFLKQSANSPSHDFHNDPFAVSAKAAIKPLEH